MIVTCESCKSRYKLDDSKITGRGAKITCPRCKHVFVVYSRPLDAPAEAPKPAGPAAPPPDWDEDEPTRIAGDKGAHEAALPARPAPPPPREPVEERAKASAADVAARAATLDFRKVGVTTWKVKVKIGLIYDFSDIKTLRKYIQDGRVTPADVISWDGKAWKPIGEIPDLDAFFVDTWDMLAARKAEEAPAPAAPAPSAPAEAPAPEAAKAGPISSPGTPSPFKDPFEEMKRQQREKAAPRRAPATPASEEKGPSGTRTGVYVTIVLALAVLGGGAWWMSQRAAPPVAPGPSTVAPAPSPAPAPAPTSAGQPGGEAIRDKINREIEESLQRGAANAPSEPAVPADGGRVPVRRDGPPAGATGVPPDAVPVRPRGTRASSAPQQQTQRDQTAADHEAVGDDAAAGGDWATAAAAYGKAASLDPQNGKVQEKLGKAQYNAGDVTSAQPTLKKAASLGSREAPKYLGHIAREQGDVPGANSWYEEYLKGDPPDAADIRAVMQQMSAGG